jgi:hypothetical protein
METHFRSSPRHETLAKWAFIPSTEALAYNNSPNFNTTLQFWNSVLSFREYLLFISLLADHVP